MRRISRVLRYIRRYAVLKRHLAFPMEDFVVEMIQAGVRLENMVDSYPVYGTVLGLVVCYPDWHAVGEMRQYDLAVMYKCVLKGGVLVTSRILAEV